MKTYELTNATRFMQKKKSEQETKKRETHMRKKKTKKENERNNNNNKNVQRLTAKKNRNNVFNELAPAMKCRTKTREKGSIENNTVRSK